MHVPTLTYELTLAYVAKLQKEGSIEDAVDTLWKLSHKPELDKYRRASALLSISYIAPTFQEQLWCAEECLQLVEEEWEMDCTSEEREEIRSDVLDRLADLRTIKAMNDESDSPETPSSSADEEPWAMSWGDMNLFERMLDEKAASGGSEVRESVQCERKGVSEGEDNEVWFDARSESATQDICDAWIDDVVQRLLSDCGHT